MAIPIAQIHRIEGNAVNQIISKGQVEGLPDSCSREAEEGGET